MPQNTPVTPPGIPDGLDGTFAAMADLASIRQPVDREMREFQGHFKEAMRTSVPLLDHITRYIVKSRGKQMRPMLVYLTAKACGGSTDRSHVAATLIELLHTATLVHDDVVDRAETRRGFFSINALWKSKIAVLVGDYLLSRGLLISMERDAVDLLRITSRAVESMSEGAPDREGPPPGHHRSRLLRHHPAQDGFAHCGLLRRRGGQRRRRRGPG